MYANELRTHTTHYTGLSALISTFKQKLIIRSIHDLISICDYRDHTNHRNCAHALHISQITNLAFGVEHRRKQLTKDQEYKPTQG